MKNLLIFLSVVFISACGTTWTIPANKTSSDFYGDSNTCQAESARVTGMLYGNYYKNCMRAKGYVDR